MNKTAKKTAFGITGAAAATLLVGGFAAPAMADDTSNSWETSSTTSTTHLSDLLGIGDVTAPIVLSPSVGDIGNGNALLSGNDVSAPVASGNDTSVSDVLNPSVSDVANPSTGNGTTIDGGDIGTSIDDLVDGGDIGTNVDNLVGDILGDLGLGFE